MGVNSGIPILDSIGYSWTSFVNHLSKRSVADPLLQHKKDATNGGLEVISFRIACDTTEGCNELNKKRWNEAKEFANNLIQHSIDEGDIAPGSSHHTSDGYDYLSVLCDEPSWTCVFLLRFRDHQKQKSSKPWLSFLAWRNQEFRDRKALHYYNWFHDEDNTSPKKGTEMIWMGVAPLFQVNHLTSPEQKKNERLSALDITLVRIENLCTAISNFGSRERLEQIVREFYKKL